MRGIYESHSKKIKNTLHSDSGGTYMHIITHSVQQQRHVFSDGKQ